MRGREADSEGPEGQDEGGAGIDRLAVAFTLGSIALGAVAVLAIPPLREAVGDAIRGDTEALRTEIRDLGAGGLVILYALIMIHTFVWYPAEIVDAAAGFVYGFWGALALVMAGWIAQGTLAWAIGRRVARPPLRRLIGTRRFDEAERLVEGGGAALMLAVRLIPIVPFSLMSFVIGAMRVPLPRFLWTTAVGYLPITAIFVYLGSQLESLSPTDPVLIGAAVLLIALIALGRPVSRRLAAARRGS